MNSICETYIIDYDSIKYSIEKHSASKILIQAPDGLKPIYRCIVEELGDKYELYLSDSPSYGGCDIAVDEAEKLGVELIIHVGHNQYPLIKNPINIPIIYVPAYYKWEPDEKIVSKIIENIDMDKSIGLISTIQHTRTLKKLQDLLNMKGYKTIVGKPSYNVMEPGQILGCEYSAALNISNEVDLYLVVAGGRFHAIGLALITDKNVYGLDPYVGEIWNASREAYKYLAKRLYLISKTRSQGFRNVGLIIGMKPGQYRENIVNYLTRISMEKAIDIRYITSNNMDHDRLVAIDNALDLDIYVITSCPRLPIDDLGDFYKPVFTPGEYIMVLKGSEKYIYPW